MSESDRDDGVSRRRVLECMTWAGTGVLWTIAGGVPRSLGIIGEAAAQEARGLTFLQISDSHIGFDFKTPYPNAVGTLDEAIAKVNALPAKPAFMIHTGDISHLIAGVAVRRRRSDHLADAARCSLRSRRARLRRRGPQALSLSATAAAPRAPAGTASTPTACTSSGWSTSSISGPAGSAISATNSLNGSKPT